MARALKAAGWKLGEVTTDNGSEFRARAFGDAVRAVGATQRRIKAGRADSNGCVERLRLTILEECLRPAFARSLAPKITALEKDLDEYLHYFNYDRAHTGRLTQGRVPPISSSAPARQRPSDEREASLHLGVRTLMPHSVTV
jgi:transposase InsO family protein